MTFQPSFRISKEANLDFANISTGNTELIPLTPTVLPAPGVYAYCSRIGDNVMVSLVPPANNQNNVIGVLPIVLTGLPPAYYPKSRIIIPIQILNNGSFVIGIAAVDTNGQISIQLNSSTGFASPSPGLYNFSPSSLSYIGA